jgi:hypothetical protein
MCRGGYYGPGRIIIETCPTKGNPEAVIGRRSGALRGFNLSDGEEKFILALHAEACIQFASIELRQKELQGIMLPASPKTC